MSVLSKISGALLVLTLASPAAAKSSILLEVREHTKARLTTSDVYIRTLKGKVVRKVYVAAGRVKLTDGPVGTFDLEARSRVGNLVGRSRVVLRDNALSRVVIGVKPAPHPTAARARPARAGAARIPKSTGATRAGPVQRGTPSRRHTRSRAPSGRRGRSSGGGVQPIKVGAVLPPSRDWGKGKIRVLRGDVYDAKGRRISGKIQLYSGKKAIGYGKVVSGYFTLYDLQSGTYQLRFATLDNKQKVTTNVPIVTGKLGKAVLKAQ